MTSTPLPAEHQAQYIKLIDEFLLTANLEVVTAKQIRKFLEVKIGKDLTSLKETIQNLIIERFDRAVNRHSCDAKFPPSSVTEKKGCDAISDTNSNKKRVKCEPDINSKDDLPPKKKKRKQSCVSEETDDEKYAKALQAQENKETRSMRAATQRKSKVKATKRRNVSKKSDNKVKASDESDLQAGSDESKENSGKKKGAFHKLHHLSEPLAELLGESKLSRPQVVKNIWKHIKAHNLQDPNDKRQIICDEQMRLVFKQDRVHMFTMNKLLANQIYDIDE